jgi:hypothetical protein
MAFAFPPDSSAYFTLNGSVIVFELGPLSTGPALLTSKARPI